jgi:hypothetical protein
LQATRWPQNIPKKRGGRFSSSSPFFYLLGALPQTDCQINVQDFSVTVGRCNLSMLPDSAAYQPPQRQTMRAASPMVFGAHRRDSMTFFPYYDHLKAISFVESSGAPNHPCPSLRFLLCTAFESGSAADLEMRSRKEQRCCSSEMIFSTDSAP